MSTMIQLRNVPDELHRLLKSRAALAGRSLSDFLIEEIRQIAERPTVEELRAKLRSREPVQSDSEFADLVRKEREAR